MYLGPTPGRDDRHRGGVFTEQTYQDYENTQLESLIASTEPVVALVLGGAPNQYNNSTGSPYPWENKWGVYDGNLNTNNGNKITQVPLFSWKQRGGLPVGVTLYHNSEAANNNELGHNWSWTYNISIWKSHGVATLHWGDALCVPFTLPGSGYGTCTSPTGIFDTLVRNTSGTYTLTKKDQSVYQFNTNGYCTSISDPNGNTQSLTYNTGGYVTKVTDATGRYFNVNYNSSNLITSFVDFTGRTWTLTIPTASDDLTQVSYPAISGTTYTDQFTYGTGSVVVTHVDKNGKTWSFTYNSGGVLASETDPLSHTNSYTYTASSTTKTDPLSETSTDNYSSGLLASHVDEASYSDARVYDSSNNLKQYTDKRGKVWNYTFDSM